MILLIVAQGFTGNKYYPYAGTCILTLPCEKNTLSMKSITKPLACNA